jgi:hypothetical protein
MGRILVHRPKGMRYTLLREELLHFFDWDHCAAYIAQCLEQKTAERLDDMKVSSEKEGLLWVRVTEEFLYEDMLRSFSTRTIRDTLKKMEERGVVVTAKESIGKVKKLLYNYKLVDSCLSNNRTLKDLPRATGKNSDAPEKFPPFFPNCVNSADDYNNVLTIPISNHIPVVPFSQNSEPTTPTPDQDPLHPEALKPEGVAVPAEEPANLVSLHKTLSYRFKNLKKAGGFQAHLKEKLSHHLERMWLGWSERQVLAAFESWKSRLPWLEFDPEHRVNSFFAFLRDANPEEYPVAPQAEPATPSLAPSRYLAAGNSAKATESPKTDFPARWNELVPEAPADPSLFPSCPKSYRDPVFVERFDEICTKARKLIQEGADIKFGFLLKESTGRFRWQELLADELNWMRPKGATKSHGGTAANGKDIFDEAIALVMKGKKP